MLRMLLLLMMMMMMSVLMIMILMMMIVSVDGVLPIYMLHLAGKFGSLGKATTSTAAAAAGATAPAGTVRGAGSTVEAGPTFQLVLVMVIREVMWVTGTSVMGAVGAAAISDDAGGWHLLQSAAGWKRRSRSRGQGVTAAA